MVVTEPKPIKRMFYVAMRKIGAGGRASCVDDDKQTEQTARGGNRFVPQSRQRWK